MTQYYKENFAPLLPQERNAAILDIGCGNGDLVRYLLDLGYRNITAIDRDETSITGLDSLPGVTAIQHEISDSLPPELGGPWDLIIAKEMIYYLDRREAARFVRSLAKALAPDGQLIVEIFNGSLPSSRFTELKDPAILTSYTDLGLKRLLEWNGLKVVRLYGAYTGGSVLYRFLHDILFQLYRWQLILERGRDDELPQIGSKLIMAVARRA